MSDHVSPPQFAHAHLSTGVRLHYAELGNASSQPVVLLHGFTDSWFSYSGVLSALAAHRRVFALDQRGHGDSDRPAHGYAMADFAADVLALMDAMSLASATVVGHSMGSFIALHTALAAPERVDRLVLIGAAASAHNESVLELQQAVDALEDPVPTDFARAFQLSTIYHPVPDAFLERVVAESLKLPAHVWKGALTGVLAADYTAQISRIRMPTLILQGDHDDVFPPEAQRALAAGIVGASLRVYRETGHAVHWERPELVARDLIEFISH